MKKGRSLKQTLIMFKNQILVRLGYVLINKQGNLVMQYNGQQLRSNHNRKRLYSLDDLHWKVLCHSWNMDDEVILSFMKKGR